MKARFLQNGDSIDHTPVAAVSAGDVVLVGTIPMVAKLDIAAGALGSLCNEGEFEVAKVTGALTAGDAIYWDVDGDPVGGTAGTGACGGTSTIGHLMGVCTKDAASDAQTVRVKLTAAKRTTTIAGSVTADDITGSDASLGIGGLQAAQGGAILLTGGTSTTSGNAGGAVGAVGGTPGATGVGGAVNFTGGAGGSTSGSGGDVTLTGGAGTAGNGPGGSIIATPGAKHGSGIPGGVFLRSSTGLLFKSQPAATAEADGNQAVAAADMINGICVHTVTTGRTLTTPTGAQITAACPADLAVGDSFDFTVITVGTGADDISTLTAGDADVTFVGKVTVGPDIAEGGPAFGTWRFRYSGTNAWVGYRIG